jgi:diazepam-binding inhibitor (GABA receptor modulating acyl-CoA-binding protein)
MNNSAHFNLAAETVKKLKVQPSDDELLTLYGWYKQATVGDVNVPKPGFLDFKGQKKWESWSKVKGASLYDSEVNYIMIVNNLIKKYGVQ